ncbi:efflux RND transporter permease subunit [Pseudoxanthomonas sp. F37]|uniref:efflux RND transporter permease subunit n=1 Tax=Pseudoxanthomonas TaxID=83618 RepID=UPI001FD2ECB5|nr:MULTISPECIES: efflux RND transporter permease subunit [Pseudoxanthomonas]UOV05804.1 efflux RND transporter permease subunit [Pseudoxanthomonas mexicana]UOV07380.1 efflux RND transporter permease subunit [Pseudoxanthomonas sp. F37]
MNISAWSIRKPLPAVLAFILLTAAGLYAFRQLAISKFPDLTVPTVTVTVNLPGATPSTLETQVTRKIEDAVASIADIDDLTSTINEGVSTTVVAFDLGKNGNIAKDEVRDAVDRIRVDLPSEIEAPIVSLVNVAGDDMITYAVTADGWNDEELSWFIDNAINKRLFGIAGVGAVKRVGGVDREVRVDLRPEALQGFGVSPAQLSQQLAKIQQEQPGGRTTVGGNEQAVRTLATVDDASDLTDYPIFVPDGRKVRLSTLASVHDGHAEVTQLTTLDGTPVIGFSVQRTLGSSEVDVGDAVRESIDALQKEMPRLRFVEVASTTPEAEASYESSMHMLYEGALLAVVVVFWFLRDWRATFISAVALPLSIIPTFAVMYWFGFSLNMITLLALAVVVGILVDDAIVEVENIDRHLGMGKTPLEASLEAADEIGTAVIATSCTLAAVFIPVAFMPGIPGKFFKEFGWTAAAAVLFSLLVARLVTPMMAAYMLKPMPEHKGDSRLMTWYLGWADRALRHRGRTLWLAFWLFVASMAIIPLIKMTFIPGSDGVQSSLMVELPPGSSLQSTQKTAETARALIADIPEIEHIFITSGAGGSSGGPGGASVAEVRKATLTLRWKDDRDRSQAELEAQVRDRLSDLPGVRLSFQGGEPGRATSLVLAGDDPVRLAEVSRDVEREIRQLPGLGTVSSSAALVRPELIVRPDAAKASDLGVSTAEIAAVTRVATRGDYEQYLAKLNLPERQVPIRVQLQESALSDPSLLGQLRVATAAGASVPLSAIADVTTESGPSQIARFDRQRNVTITVDLNGQPLGDVDKQIKALPSLQNLPEGVQLQATGDAEIFEEMFSGFVVAMIAGIFCVYGVLLLLFNHASQPLTILVAVPLAAGGAFGALLLTGTDISLPVLIGLILLIGIAVKNSILLVDYAVIAEKTLGLSRHEALIDACHKRARPVIMTTLAMGAGMLPIALGFVADSSFRAPMAITVIGGLLTSTVLSLVVVPAAFTLVDDVETWLLRKMGRSGQAA